MPLLLKDETVKKIRLYDAKENAAFATELSYPKAKLLYEDMNKNYSIIYKSGYRKMPDKMYEEWLVSLKTEKEKYQNKNINFTEQKK